MKMREAQRKIEICSVRLKFATDYRRQYTQASLWVSFAQQSEQRSEAVKRQAHVPNRQIQSKTTKALYLATACDIPFRPPSRTRSGGRARWPPAGPSPPPGTSAVMWRRSKASSGRRRHPDGRMRSNRGEKERGSGARSALRGGCMGVTDGHDAGAPVASQHGCESHTDAG
eukprot:scaffold2923_cov112-Isochrysis_galbana.AAC.3